MQCTVCTRCHVRDVAGRKRDTYIKRSGCSAAWPFLLCVMSQNRPRTGGDVVDIIGGQATAGKTTADTSIST